MKRNMKEWMAEYIKAPVKKAMPILSFPGIQIIGHTVEEMVKSGRTSGSVYESHCRPV